MVHKLKGFFERPCFLWNCKIQVSGYIFFGYHGSSDFKWTHMNARLGSNCYTTQTKMVKPKMRGAQSKVPPIFLFFTSYGVIFFSWILLQWEFCFLATSTGLVALLFTYKYIYSNCEYWVNVMSELAPPSLLLPYTYFTHHHASLENLYPLRKGPMIVVAKRIWIFDLQSLAIIWTDLIFFPCV